MDLKIKYDLLQKSACEHFDKDGAHLFRLETDPVTDDTSPHIVAIRVDK